jgi:hypothetical protein
MKKLERLSIPSIFECTNVFQARQKTWIWYTLRAGLTLKYFTRLKVLPTDKQSSLFVKRLSDKEHFKTLTPATHNIIQLLYLCSYNTNVFSLKLNNQQFFH